MFSPTYKRYVLALLTFVYTTSYLDRCLIILLLQPIKDDLHLSDTQLGLLTGIAFGLFYATLGVPIARWADRGNRATITSVAIAVWGVTVMACMVVTNFFQLVLARIAAAVGESGCMPPSYSLLGDFFPGSAERTRAMSIYWLGSPVSALFSFIAGGWLNELYGWRITFFVMGVPALLLAVIVKITVTDPRENEAGGPDRMKSAPRMTEVVKYLYHQKSSRHLSVAIVLLFTIGLGLSPWYAAFMMRSHGMSTTELGVWMGLTAGIGGAAGTLLGGDMAARWFAESERAQMRVAAIAVACLVPFFLLFLLIPGKHEALLALAPLVAVFNSVIGPALALLQRLVANEIRATTLAVVMLLANLIGMGIGPQIVGIISDWLAPVVGRDSLRYAMLGMSFVSLWAAYHFWCVGRTIEKDLAAVASQVRLTLSDVGSAGGSLTLAK